MLCLFALVLSGMGVSNDCVSSNQEMVVPFTSKSITSNDKPYLEVCAEAAHNPKTFAHFRALDSYRHVVEVDNQHQFAEYLLNNAAPDVLSRLADFAILDAQVGGAPCVKIGKMGSFSGTTLRYIIVADQIKKLFNLPSNACVVEIGAGFGGQSFVLSQLQSIDKYYIYDLPQVEALISKVAEVMQISQIVCMPLQDNLLEDRVDLLISNYAFSECHRAVQLDYFERVMRKADRGYVIYNRIANGYYGIDSMSPEEFVALLEKHGMHPRMSEEPVSTFAGNVLITWCKGEG